LKTVSSYSSEDLELLAKFVFTHPWEVLNKLEEWEAERIYIRLANYDSFNLLRVLASNEAFDEGISFLQHYRKTNSVALELMSYGAATRCMRRAVKPYLRRIVGDISDRDLPPHQFPTTTEDETSYVEIEEVR